MAVTIRRASAGTVCVLGGTGFVGQHLIRRLVDGGYRLRVITRHRERHRDLFVMPGVELLEGDVNDLNQLRDFFAGCDAVINLLAILHERHRGEFQKMHVVLPSRIIQACEDSAVRRLIHMSALNADASSDTSRYLHSRGQGERLVRQASTRLDVTIFRPSVIFGPGDRFFNRFAWMLRAAPLLFPVVCAPSRLAPVYVADVVDAIAVALGERSTCGEVYDLCGPRVYTMEQLVELTAHVIGVRRYLIGLGPLPSRLLAMVLGRLPGRLFTRDNYLSLQKDTVCAASRWQQLGIHPHTVEAMIPRYLAAATARGQYDRFRSRHRNG